ncbi:putative ribosomal protein l19 [Erysiphe neolycopersici]|uniref:Putative ribosomal protein l19 n=1 Tax=Erysiphe neolycopersici TaxID=212602 RepID=A0A420HRC2_9PEZI|nr:putative ribosomal protein l19 [Erysiphe neolycopersici]
MSLRSAPNDHESLPSSPPSSPSAFKSSPYNRGIIRNGTFILASTGEHIRRQITLQEHSIPGSFSYNRTGDTDSSIYNAPLHLESFTSLSDILNLSFKIFNVKIHLFRRWLETPIAKAILKCSLAYLLGSLGTFFPPLTHFLGRQDGKHIVATVMVFFHPARSAGSMAEAAVLGFASVVYATVLGFLSMAISVFSVIQFDMIEIASGFILIFFYGGGLGLVGWFKQNSNSPLVGVACSLTSLSLISILTKEAAIQTLFFSSEKIIQVIKMVAVGITMSAILSFLLWPVSARKELRENMIKAADSAGDMLSMIARGFLTGSENELHSTMFTNAQKKHMQSFAKMNVCLREAKFEHYLLGTESLYKYESNLVNCLERLSQSIGGLRSAAMTQFTLLKELPTHGNSTPTSNSQHFPEPYAGTLLATVIRRNQEFAAQRSIDRVIDENSKTENHQKGPNSIRTIDERIARRLSLDSNFFTLTPRNPSQIFSRFIILLGPPIKSLVYTLHQILLEFPIKEKPENAKEMVDQFKKSLGCALNLYSNARSNALKELYKDKELDIEWPLSIEADFEEVAASCGYFSTCLHTFAKEMLKFMEILEELKEESENSRRSWSWLWFWRKTWKSQKTPAEDEELLIPKIPETRISRKIPDLELKSLAKRKRSMAQSELNMWQTLAYRVLSFIKFLNRDDVRFAIKVGIGASIYALFAYIPATRPFYQHWRGEWGLLSYMLVCSTTIGASNNVGSSRFIGTIIGALIAIMIWMLCQGNVWALAFCGWFISLPCFYLMIAKGKGPFGRYIMLTYNLSCLYSYSLSNQDGDDDDDEGGIAPIISEIALHRLVSVLTGVIWGMIVTRIIWPVSARKEFQDGLSLLWLRMGLIWKRDPLAALLEGDSPTPYMKLREEFALHRYLLRLENLRNSARSELELRGPFPTKGFGHIIDSTTKMLDAFHAMNIIIRTDLIVTEGEKCLLQYTADERAQLCLIISHLYQVLASSLKLEYPINDPLPSITKSRDRLLAKIFQYRKDSSNAQSKGKLVTKDEDYELLYAYILVTGQLAEEIGKVEVEISKLYGIMNEDYLRLK